MEKLPALVDPHLFRLHDDPEIFYGFWGKIMNDYRASEPHEGYDILRKWRDTRFGSDHPLSATIKERWEKFIQEENHRADKYENCKEVEGVPGPFFIYTSNIDGHNQRARFALNEIYEIHGCLEEWQCSIPCRNEIWNAPQEFCFEVNSVTMCAPNNPQPSVSVLPEHFQHNHPVCKHCGALARPRVCFFKDLTWIYPAHAHARYQTWLKVVRQIAIENTDVKGVIIEVGCSILVNSVRMQTRYLREQVFKDRYCHTIRINPDFPNADDITVPKEKITGLKGKALDILQELDIVISSLQ